MTPLTDKLQELRTSKNVRLSFMVGLIVLVVILYLTGVIKK